MGRSADPGPPVGGDLPRHYLFCTMPCYVVCFSSLWGYIMDIQLVKAESKDAQTIWEMQVKSFQKLLDKYQDFETSPASEPVDNVRRRLEQENTYYYFI